jgi:hypothetical protein
MKITIPQTNFYQANNGEKSGNMFASWNLDLLSEFGKIRVSPISLGNVVSTGLPIAFTYDLTASGYTDILQYALCGTSVYYWTGTAWSALLNILPTNDPTCDVYHSDMVKFNAGIVVSLSNTGVGNGSISRLASGTWTPNWLNGSGLILSAANLYYPHPLCVSYNNLLLIGNGRNIVSVDTSDNVNTAKVVLPEGFIIEWIKSASNGVWIGAKNTTQEEAKVFYWDGYSENYNKGYNIGSEYCFAGVINKQDVPFVVNGYGQLMAFNGSGFEEVAKFPVANSKKHSLVGFVGANGYPPIHRNGMAIIDDEVHILLNAGVDDDDTKLLESQLSGIWCYTRENGLFHRFSLGNNSTSNNYDYGFGRLGGVGALVERPRRLGSFYAGALATASAYIYSADYTDTAYNKLGYFITPKIYAQELDEMWNSINVVFKKLETATDFIRVKYRFDKKYETGLATVSTGTWISTTEFTVSAIGDLEEGDEVEILSGIGAGISSKIVSISGTTITIDDIIVPATGTFTFRIEQWTELEKIQDLVSIYKTIGIGKNNTQIQFKILLFGKGNSPELEKIIVNSKPQIVAQ